MNIGQYTFAEFRDMAAEFHSYPAPGLLIGGYMVELAKRQMPEGTLYEVIVETGKCLPDAVQLLTPCSFGNGWMKIVQYGRYALTMFDKHTGQGWRVALNSDKVTGYPEIRDWFFKLKAKQDQDTQQLMTEIELAGDSLCSLQKATVSRTFLHKKSMGAVSRCPICNEAFPIQDGAICRGCQEGKLYASLEGAVEGFASPEQTLTAVPVTQAIGKTALHDMTRIVPGQHKGPAVRAGERITAGDVCRLQQMGRSSVFIQESEHPGADWIHEDEAALAMAQRMAGPGVEFSSSPREGKINFFSKFEGLLQVQSRALVCFNMVPNVMCASRKGLTVVDQGRPFAGCRALPLYISRLNLSRALSSLGDEPLFEVLPLKPARVGVLVTGTEIFQGLIQDRFLPVIESKVERFKCSIVARDLVPDDRQAIKSSVRRMLKAGAELVITTAGLSVDPDDVTRKGLLDAGMSEVLFGAPILPGAMTLLGRINGAKIIGVPACALFYPTTSFDLLLPWHLAGIAISRSDLARLAEGGFCLNCKSCTFPKCPFGK